LDEVSLDQRQEVSGDMTMGVEHHALLFAWLAREATSRFGEEGEEAIRAGVREYGSRRGTRTAAHAKAEGRPCDYLSYALYGEVDFGQTDNDSRIVKETPQVEIEVGRCSWHNTWRERGLLEYGRLYCQEIDAALMRGFNPAMAFELDGSLTSGASRCRFVYVDAQPRLAVKLKNPPGQVRAAAIRPFAFHVADLYDALSTVLLQRFGESARPVLAAAMASFAAEYGAAAAEQVAGSSG
jgi:hypothetical protein